MSALTPRLSRSRRHRASRSAPYAFAAPATLLFICFTILPIGYTIYLGFQTTRVSGLGLGAGARRQVFAGLSNYTSALSDPAFTHSVLRVLAYGCVLVPVMLGLALLFALLLDSRRVKYQRFSRIAIFLPYAVPVVIATLLWGFLYLPTVSPITDVLRNLHLPQPDFLANNTILFSIANIGVWGGTGFNMIVIYTSLRSIPRELHEAARIDGASEVQIALRVKVPLVVPALVVTALFAVITTLQVFSEPTTIRPLTETVPQTWSPLMTVYQDAFIRNDIYAAAAASILIAAGILVLSLGLVRLTSRQALGGMAPGRLAGRGMAPRRPAERGMAPQ
jgi:multiple sugar transport system permease protein